MAYCLFLSYARGDKDPYLERFIDDLNAELCGASKELLDSKTICFRDCADIQVGELWHGALTEVLRTARIFLYLHSPAYFTRSWCGREWSAF